MNIKELAEQAGLKIAIVLRVCGEDLTEWQQEHWAQLEKFAELVAAAEREKCAKLCEEGVDYQHPTVKHITLKNFSPSPALAAAIRARGDKHD